jgi:hypothetical protein
MFELRKGNLTVKFNPGFKVDMELNHPLSSSDDMPGNLTLPGDLPVCPENDLFLQFFVYLELRDGVRVYDNILMLFHGEMLYNGMLCILDGENAMDTGKYTFSYVATSFAIDYADKNLKDIDYGDNLVLGETAEEVADFALAASEGSYPDFNCVFPMQRNDNFYGAANTEFLGVINNFDVDTGTYFINGPTLNEYALVPYLYLRFIFDRLWKGYKITGDWFTGTRAKAIVYNNYALDARDKLYYVKAAQTPGQTFNWPADTGFTTVNNIDVEIEDPDSCFAASVYVVQAVGIHRVNGSFHASLASGATRIKWIVLAGGSILGAGYGYPVEGERSFIVNFASAGNLNAPFIGDDIEFRIVGQKNESGLWTSAGCAATIWNLEIEYINQDANEQNVYAKELAYKNHVPDVKVTDLIAGFKDAGMIIQVFPAIKVVKIDYVDQSFKNRPVPIETARDFYRKTIEENKGYTFNFEFPDDELKTDELPDLSKYTLFDSQDCLAGASLPTGENQLLFLRNLNQYWKSDGTVDDGFTWKFFCHNYYDYVMGEGETDIKLPFSPMLLSQEVIDGKTYIVPIAIERGNSAIFNTGVNETPFKILFWHGFLFNDMSQEYPFASPVDMDLNGTYTGDLSLRFDDELNGFRKKLFGTWYNYLINGTRVKLYIDFNSTFLREFEWVNSYRIGNQRFVFLRINSSYTEDKIEVSEVDAILL